MPPRSRPHHRHRRAPRLAATLAIVAALAAVGASVAAALRGENPAGGTTPLAPRGADPVPKADPRPRSRSRRVPDFPRVRYRDSRALGTPSAGSLVRGTLLPARGSRFATWDPILRRSPSRAWRRYGTDDLVRVLMRVQRRFAAAEPGELPMLIGDLSRPRGGDFGRKFGFVGHSTHQNGLDADVYYPRTDRRLKAPKTVAQVDRRLAQQLVDLFVAAGAETVLVGPNLGLTGPAGVVKPFPGHDNHLHVRIANPDR